MSKSKVDFNQLRIANGDIYVGILFLLAGLAGALDNYLLGGQLGIADVGLEGTALWVTLILGSVFLINGIRRRKDG